MAAVFLRELLEPDVGALRDHDDGGHPGVVGGEGFVLDERGLVVGGIAAAANAVGADDEFFVKADELVAVEALRLPAHFAVRVGVVAAGVEAHPDGDVFFADDVDREQDALQVFAEVGRPLFADELELAGERVGGGEHGRLKRFDQRAGFRANGRARIEVVGQASGEGLVGRGLLQGLVVEELAEWQECGIDVGQPEHQQLLQRGLAVGKVFTGLSEPL